MKKPEITDEEIRSMMDFQQVLREHQKVVATRTAKYWSAGLGAVVITSLIVYYFTQSTEPATSMPSPVPLAQKEVPVVRKDSAEKKVVTTPLPISKSSVSKATVPADKPSSPQAEGVKANIYLPSEPVDGYPHLYKYFNDQLTYPKEAAKDSIQGVVSVTFIVRPTGAVDHITITNSLGPLFDAEALRVMQGMPPWKPAQLNGKAVPSKMSVPLTFRIETIKK